MNIKFIDKNTVEITASLKWIAARPPASQRKIIKKEEFIAKFKKKHPSYTVEKVEGPDKISNFREERQSKGAWVLTVSKIEKSKLAPKKVKKVITKPQQPQKEKKQGV